MSKVDAYGIPTDDQNQNGRRILAHAMMGRPNNSLSETMPHTGYAVPTAAPSSFPIMAANPAGGLDVEAAFRKLFG